MSSLIFLFPSALYFGVYLKLTNLQCCLVIHFHFCLGLDETSTHLFIFNHTVEQSVRTVYHQSGLTSQLKWLETMAKHKAIDHSRLEWLFVFLCKGFVAPKSWELCCILFWISVLSYIDQLALTFSVVFSGNFSLSKTQVWFLFYLMYYFNFSVKITVIKINILNRTNRLFFTKPTQYTSIQIALTKTRYHVTMSLMRTKETNDTLEF